MAPEYMGVSGSGFCWFCLGCAACGFCGLSPTLAAVATGYVGTDTEGC